MNLRVSTQQEAYYDRFTFEVQHFFLWTFPYIQYIIVSSDVTYVSRIYSTLERRTMVFMYKWEWINLIRIRNHHAIMLILKDNELATLSGSPSPYADSMKP